MKTAITIFALAIFARADTVELKTGEKIEGKVKRTTETAVVIQVGGQPITFGMDKVRSIHIGAAPSAQEAPPGNGEGLEAVKALQSIVSSGVSYRDYAPRVLDARVRVDKYLESVRGSGSPSAIHLSMAMTYYEMASAAWGARLFGKRVDGISPEEVEIGRTANNSKVLNSCTQLHKLIQNARLGSNYPPDHRWTFQEIGQTLGEHPGTFWECASLKIGEAEAAKIAEAAKKVK